MTDSQPEREYDATADAVGSYCAAIARSENADPEISKPAQEGAGSHIRPRPEGNAWRQHPPPSGRRMQANSAIGELVRAGESLHPLRRTLFVAARDRDDAA